jgi:hypothetical protein
MGASLSKKYHSKPFSKMNGYQPNGYFDKTISNLPLKINHSKHDKKPQGITTRGNHWRKPLGETTGGNHWEKPLGETTRETTGRNHSKITTQNIF